MLSPCFRPPKAVSRPDDFATRSSAREQGDGIDVMEAGGIEERIVWPAGSDRTTNRFAQLFLSGMVAVRAVGPSKKIRVINIVFPEAVASD